MLKRKMGCKRAVLTGDFDSAHQARLAGFGFPCGQFQHGPRLHSPKTESPVIGAIVVIPEHRKPVSVIRADFGEVQDDVSSSAVSARAPARIIQMPDPFPLGTTERVIGP